jgi:hypothetical protein
MWRLTRLLISRYRTTQWTGPPFGGPLTASVGRQRLRERPQMVTKPVAQLRPIDPAGGEIEHETLLVFDDGGDLGTVEDEEGLHGGVPDALVAVDERVVLNQREAQRRGLLDHPGGRDGATRRPPPG